MAALTQDYSNTQYGTSGDEVIPKSNSLGAEANTTLYAGGMGAIDAAGYAVPASADRTLKILGRIRRQVVNTVAAGAGSAGALTVELEMGSFRYDSGTGGDLITFVNVGQLCYASDDHTVNLTSAGNTRPCAGLILNVDSKGRVAVLLGFPSLYQQGNLLGSTYANAAAMTASLAANRIDGQTSVKMDDYSLWVWEATSNAFADSSTIAPTDVGSGAGRFVILAGSGAEDVAEYGVSRVLNAVNVVTANVASLASYTVAGNDGITNFAGDIVLLVGQTTVAQNGLYVVGTITTGTAPLTLLPMTPAGSTYYIGSITVLVGAGTLFANTRWINQQGGVIGTNDPQFYPAIVTQPITLVAGAKTVANVPILSATKTNYVIRRITPTGTTLTISYEPAAAATPGKLGTASVTIDAMLAAGTINTADTSALLLSVVNF